MVKYITQRLVMAVITLIIIVFILFALLEYMPGSPFNDEKLSDDQRAVLNQKYGLNQPTCIRFKNYIVNLFKGDFGDSYVIQKNMAISEMLKTRFRISIKIGLQAMAIGVFFGLFLGIIAAIWHNTIIDPITSFLSMLGASIPSYVFGLGLMYFLGYKLHLFPILYSEKEGFQSTILPSVALSMLPIANIARFSRNEMVEVLQSEYIILAQSKGVEKWAIILKHALRNALIPILTVVAPMIVGMMLGSTVIENIFSIPGIGNLFITAIQVNDYNVIISIAFVYSVMYIGIMLLVDLLYGIIDPRIRIAGGVK